MLLVYASRTGNIERFVRKLGALPALRLYSGEETVQEPCLLLTYTTGLGQVPAEVQQFASRNAHWIQAVAASGNRNWGDSYGRAADVLAQQLQVPVVQKFELSGRPGDVVRFLEVLEGVKGLERSGHGLSGTEQSGDAEKRRVLSD
ncbi:class Ib ribonucleoside-diphosphate reductase assembly flavoprotein NrdI [Deinococcus roseus]|uniref:Protein NrdI n=1 Tax=Deinococcus roseus TaxID=392414 RepID=A0ABQ2CZK6_9DEIO|nr:class Ib ribonucleoside-diphosphate reductase assembly flavoprotein NrdI [Deinococcus roseus]GGJ31761.1 protein NrdI [Deinococcus roseus]